jgi:hypothetical protein
MVRVGIRLNRENLSCKFDHRYWEYLGERWMGQAEMSDCTYNGDKDISMVDKCDKKCPAFEPVEIKLCEKHNNEYIDECPECEDELWGIGDKE